MLESAANSEEDMRLVVGRPTDLEARKQSGGETSGLGGLEKEEGRGKKETHDWEKKPQDT